MMSLRAVNAGSGYEYLLRSVATNDASNTKAPSLSAYYQAQGTPPGKWLGTGLDGLKSEQISRGEIITELHMAALFGEGLHPDADGILQQEHRLKAAYIGRPFPTFTNLDPVLVALRDAEHAFRQSQNRLPSEAERTDLVIEIATPLFTEINGEAPLNGQEVVRWVNARKDLVKQAVAGYDFTFSPVKSVSALWAVADEETAAKIAKCHHKAVAEAIKWAESEFIRTRRGAGGKIQAKTKGLIAAEFTHFDTRDGDPDLHSHVLLSNKVQAEDGSWLSLDGRTIFRFHQSMSFRYDAMLMNLLSQELNIEFQSHARGEGKQPVWEVAGISEKVLETFSKRRIQARPVYEAKVAAYIEKTGATPSKRIHNQLWQQAILETRDAKKPAKSLTDLREQWQAEIASLDDGKTLLEQTRSLANGGDMKRPLFTYDEHEESISKQSIEIVTERRNVFRRSHVLTAVASVLNQYRFDSAEMYNEVHAAMTAKVLHDYGLALNGTEKLSVPAPMKNNDGEVVDKLVDSELFTTSEILSAEQKVLDAADEITAYVASEKTLNDVLQEHFDREGWQLNDGQKALARHLVSCGSLVATGVGPAGTGKTASMKIVAQTWQQSGAKVIGLAPSAAAAKVLAGDIGIATNTIDALTFIWRGKYPQKRGGDLSSLPVKINPGDMILVDEAGMASTENLATLVDIAHEAGAVLRFVGDHKQLGAVENGGLFGALVRSKPTAELTHVMRFGDDKQQAEASMKLRLGDKTGLDLYDHRGWLTGGARQLMLTQAAEAYLADLRAGRRSLVIASTNADVEKLNEYIRQALISQGVVTDDETTCIGGMQRAGIGDVVIARKNKRFTAKHDGIDGKVINGDIFTVVGFSDDGDLTVARQDGSTQVLPAEYVGEHVRLGYASTVHRAQGSTVDCAHAVIDAATDQAGFYVAVTRGKGANKIYAVTDVDFDLDAEHAHHHYQGEGNALTPREVLERVIARDAREKSAFETLWDEAEYATSNERIETLWFYGKELVMDAIIDHDLQRWLELLPAHQYQNLWDSEDKDEPIRAAWKQLLRVGVDPNAVMAEAITHVDDAHDIASLVNYRLQASLPKDAPDGAILPPLPDYIDGDLREWLREHVPGNLASKVAPSVEPITAGSTITGENFAGMDLSGMDLTKVTFRHCDFTNAVLSNAVLTKTKFENCQLQATDFSDAVLVSSRFKRCDMERVNFDRAIFGQQGTTLTRTLITRCQMAWATLRNAVIHALDISTTKLSHADFTGANIQLLNLEQSDYADMITDHTTVGVENICDKSAEDASTFAVRNKQKRPIQLAGQDALYDGVYGTDSELEF